MIYSSNSIEKAVEAFTSLPSIGRRTATRLVFHILRQNHEYADNFAQALIGLKRDIKLCSTCCNYTEIDPCPICASAKRSNDVICVVEEPGDVIAIERTNEYFGLYHVLHGVLNPLEGFGPDEIKVKELISRVANVSEVILAINPSVEGEVTSQYIAKLLKPFEIKISRIASGIPLGSSLEFSDEATLSRAMSGRISM